MSDLEFKKWPKIGRFLEIQMTITQKLDGTNAQILFLESGKICRVGSRNRWLSKEKDNFGFFEFVEEHVDELYEVLGDGRHYGEWCGPGIQTSEGLSHRQFFSFNPYLQVPEEYNDLIAPVPTLYQGPFDLKAIHDSLILLRDRGSAINGFDRPEGIIIELGGVRKKLYLKQLPEFEEKYLQHER